MIMENKKTVTEDDMMKAYRRWRRALVCSNIPERLLDVDPKRFESFVEPGAGENGRMSSACVASAIYDYFDWVREYIFIIDGGTPNDNDTPADIRRMIGCAILQS
jgi:hypothetical protein